MKSPHPSGRPVRQPPKLKHGRYWNYPAETYATPRLRPVIKSTVDAVSGIRQNETDSWGGMWAGKIGFVHFDRD